MYSSPSNVCKLLRVYHSQKTTAQIKYVSSLLLGPTVHDVVREGQQTMSNMEDHNNASAFGSTWNTPTISWTGNDDGPGWWNCSGLVIHRHHTVCLCVWWKLFKRDEKKAHTHKKWLNISTNVKVCSLALHWKCGFSKLFLRCFEFSVYVHPQFEAKWKKTLEWPDRQ